MISEKWDNTVVYEIYCKSFCDANGDGIGDLAGVRSKLPMLKKLGIDCIWFTPIFRSPQVDNGYDVADYEDIEPTYGTKAEFLELLSEAHAMGIRVILDMVLNHTSDQHKWFRESRKSKDNPYRDYYIWRAPKPDGSEPNNWGNRFKEGNGSAWTFDDKTGEYYLHNYSRHMPDLNWNCRAMREEVYAMMNRWLDLGVDGFRMDAIAKLCKPEGLPDSKKAPNETGHVVDMSLSSYQPGLNDILHEMCLRTWGNYDAYVIGEASVTPEIAELMIMPEREELTSLYHFQIVSRTRPLVSVPEYKQLQENWGALFNKGALTAQHLSNHDQPRQVSRFGDEKYRRESAKLLGTLTHTIHGTPYIYQGEEIGMINTYFDAIEDYNDCYTVGGYQAMVAAGADPQKTLRDLALISRDNARTPLPWTGGKNGGFTTGTPWLKLNPNYREINYEAECADPDGVFAYYQKLIALRKEHIAIRKGALKLLEKEHPALIAYERVHEKETLLILANASSDAQQLPNLSELQDFAGKCLLSDYPADDAIPKTLRPWEVRVYQKKNP